jgi:hypothetical protein
VGLGRFLSFSILLQSLGLLGWGISPSQGLYLHIEQHKHIINVHNRDMNALSGIRTHGTSVRASEGSSRIRTRGHCNWQIVILYSKKPNPSRDLTAYYTVRSEDGDEHISRLHRASCHSGNAPGLRSTSARFKFLPLTGYFCSGLSWFPPVFKCKPRLFCPTFLSIHHSRSSFRNS